MFRLFTRVSVAAMIFAAIIGLAGYRPAMAEYGAGPEQNPFTGWARLAIAFAAFGAVGMGICFFKEFREAILSIPAVLSRLWLSPWRHRMMMVAGTAITLPSLFIRAPEEQPFLEWIAAAIGISVFFLGLRGTARFRSFLNKRRIARQHRSDRWEGRGIANE